LIDLAAIVGLPVAAVVAAVRLLRSRSSWPGAFAARRWANVIMLLAAAGLVIAGNVWMVNLINDQGRPTPAQVAGTWRDGDGSTVQALPDGTFTATGLPTDTDPASDDQPHPVNGHGAWGFSHVDGVWYARFTLSGGSQFQLYLDSVAVDATPTAGFTYVPAHGDWDTVWSFSRDDDHASWTGSLPSLKAGNR
jgi:hypothetical protein